MNVLICSENHFIQVGDEIHFPLTSPVFFQRYREVWEEVLILSRLGHADTPPPGSKPLDMTGVRLIGLPDFLGPLQYARKWRRCRAIAKQALAEAESIIFRAPGTVANLVWSLLPQKTRPIGLEVLGDPGASFSGGSSRHPLRLFARWHFATRLREQCQQAYATAYVSERMVQKLYPPAPGKFTTHYSSAELPRACVLPNRRTDFPSQGPYRLVLTGGFSTMYKAQDILLAAIAELVGQGWDLHTTFIGDGKHRREIEELAANMGLAKRVEFTGALPSGAAVLAELDKAHLFVMPSRTEGIPRAMIEAMARALPCIGTDVGGMPELLDSSEMMPANDSNSLAQKIAEVLRDPARMAKLSRRNLAVAACYTQEILRDRRNKFYRYLRAGTEDWLKRHSPANRPSSMAAASA